MERDLRTILVIQALRAFVYGLGSVLLGSTLAAGRLSDAEVGAVLTAMLAGMAVTSVGVGVLGDRLGRRRLYRALLLVMGAAGAVFAVTRSLPALFAAALTGTLSTDPNESGPITSLEQAMMGGAPTGSRARVFGRYNAVAYLAGSLGALAAGGPAALRGFLPSIPADQRFLLAFPAVALACASLAARLTPAVETAARDGPSPLSGPARPPRALARSRGAVARLGALFSLDSFGGGFIVQSFLVFWFSRRFGASTALMGVVFFGAGLIQAGSSVVAGALASRIGLLNTMVFTHLPSHALLAAVPFAPTLPAAVGLLLARFVLSQMDVPARQAYVVAVVDPAERTAAAAYTNMARYATRPVGPVAAGALMQHVALSAPFLVAGGLKIAYDLALYGMFRNVPLADARTAASPGT